ncbi:MAG: GldG family protein [Planctomycetota bacterium]|nr:GldG family protein [Planctomycetota bacterium]
MALIGLNVIASRATQRVDLTSEHLYSVSPATRKVIDGIAADRPILIQAFISPSVPRELSQSRTTLVGLLRQFDQLGGDKVRVRFVSTEKYTDSADEAKRYGIEPQEIQTMVGGKFTREDVFLGVVVTGSVDDQVIIPFIDKGTPVEYELTRSVRTVSGGARKKLGILRTDAQLTGGFDMQAFRQLPEWRIVQELKKQYDVQAIGPDELADKDDLDVLLAVMPSSLTDPELDNLVKYIEAGHATLVVDDPFPRFHPNLAPKNPKPKPGGNNPFGGGPPPQPKADISRLTRALEIAWDSGESVWDRYDAHPELKDLFDSWQLFNVVYITPANEARDAFSKNSKITSGMQEMMLFYPGTMKPVSGMKLNFEPLLRGSVACRTYKWDEYVRSGMMGMMEILNPPDRDPSDDVRAPVIAAHITGPAKSGEGKSDKKINVVFVADMDMISNEFFFIRDKEWQDLKLDNIAFVMNAIDDLAGDTAVIDLRVRRPQHRTLTTVETRVRQFKEDEAKAAEKAEKDAKKALEDVTTTLQKAVDQIKEREDLDPRQKMTMARTAEENKIRELDVRKANIDNEKNKTIKGLKDRTEREVNRITNSFRALAFLLPPIPSLFLGLLVFVVRSSNERKGMNPDRMVSKR